MDKGIHDMSELFRQLGLPSAPGQIDRFIADHSLPDNVTLDRADFWNDSQAGFLREAWIEDADWVELIDQLNARLHH